MNYRLLFYLHAPRTHTWVQVPSVRTRAVAIVGKGWAVDLALVVGIRMVKAPIGEAT